MNRIKNYKNQVLLAVCLIVIMICGLIISAVKTDNGNITVKEVVISPYGADLAMSMYMPDSALETDDSGNFVNADTYPAVIINSGYTENRACLDNVSIELARRGFVVAQFDMYGHGKSDTTATRGYGNVPDPFGDDMALLGAYDVLDYLRSLGFVDQTRIGMVGHSLGGSAVGAMAASTAGFYTLQDQLLNLLHDEFGLPISAEQVTAQDADSIANEKLDEKQRILYETRKAEITKEYGLGVRNVIVLDADVGFSAPKEVEVAGNPVWRDVQANFALFANISGGLSKGIKDKDYCLSSESVLGIMGLSTKAERNTWYSVQLSGTAVKEESTAVLDFYTSPSDETIQKLADSHSLRVLVQPKGWHAFTYISGETATAAVQFFTTTLTYDNGKLAVGVNAASAAPASTGSWKIKEAASGFAFIALLLMIMPLVNLLLDSRMFQSMHNTPSEPLHTKITPALVITTLITIFVPMFLYSKGVGWAMNVKASPLSTIQIATQTAFWAALMALMILALIVVKYYAYDKKRMGVCFREMYGLKISWKNIGKSIVLGLVIFAVIAVLLQCFYTCFHAANMKVTLLGKIMYAALADHQYYSYFLYALYFFPFYLINSMLVNSFRFKNMSEKKNMIIVGAVNCSGMLLLAVCQIIFGLYMKGSPLLPTVPGTSATIYNIPFFCLMLFVSTIFTRKLYVKTGSSIPGAILNVLVFTFPAVQSYAYFVL
ncbi:alpha/beta hydrolase [Diplocloster modestus]|uniref:Dienelactone hydrolase family protein n=1 Tax=Diplocloster modestus TaxID=2850322 RepID=A0ABS6KF79_9FIRM|nr:alpha/beta fold hydrolase [Diplocloster modestus]MBU9729128.1 dienelactone hydrolase family protein [Diplocloster modestus]